MQQDGGQDRELDRRLGMAGGQFQQLRRHLFASRGVSLRTKVRVYRTMVVPVLLYGAAESWALTEAQVHRLDAFHTTCLRRITGHRRGPDCISNADLFALTHERPLHEELRESRMRWLGHASRRPDSTLVKQVLFADGLPDMVRPPGRPHVTWMDAAQRDTRALGFGHESEWLEYSQDRAAWKTLITHGPYRHLDS
jgi:hypothetical protein